MKIILFGGTFDPPHIAHSQMVQHILERHLFDEVWYVPVGSQHTKNFNTKHLTAIDHRLKMLELILTPHTRLNTFEVTSGKPSHTDFTLTSLRALHPEHSFSWLMGSDQLSKLDLWLRLDGSSTFPSILNEFDFYVYPRKGYLLDLPYGQLQIIEGVEPLADSSTQVRSRIKKGEPITELVDPRVEQYIIEHNLYR